jgi:hypothetical protein
MKSGMAHIGGPRLACGGENRVAIIAIEVSFLHTGKSAVGHISGVYVDGLMNLVVRNAAKKKRKCQ